jgi:hypothetical protein
VARARTLWEEGTRQGRQMVRLGIATSVLVAAVDLAVNGRLTLVHDLGFVALCIALALLVRPQDFWTVVFLPPLLMLGLFLVLAILAPGTIAEEDDGVVQAVVSGLAHHAAALAAGYGLTLACLAQRQRVLRRRTSAHGAA